METEKQQVYNEDYIDLYKRYWHSLQEFKAKIDKFVEEGYTEITVSKGPNWLDVKVRKLRPETDEEFETRIKREKLREEIKEAEAKLESLKRKL